MSEPSYSEFFRLMLQAADVMEKQAVREQIEADMESGWCKLSVHALPSKDWRDVVAEARAITPPHPQ